MRTWYKTFLQTGHILLGETVRTGTEMAWRRIVDCTTAGSPRRHAHTFPRNSVNLTGEGFREEARVANLQF